MQGYVSEIIRCDKLLDEAQEDEDLYKVIECYRRIVIPEKNVRIRLSVLMMICKTYLKLENITKGDFITTKSLLGHCEVMALKDGNKKNLAHIQQMVRLLKQREEEVL